MKLNRRYGKIAGMASVINPSDILRRDLLQAFTFKNPVYVQAERFSPWGPPKQIEEYICLAHEKDNEVFFPRGIVPHAQLSPESFKQFCKLDWRDCTTDAPVKFPALVVTPNPEQEVLFKAFKKAMREESHPFRSLLFVAPTSTGKTLSQAMLAAETRQRTLVLCLTNLIKRAWYDDLKMGYNLNSEKVGLIQQQTWRIGKHFTLASVATLAKRKNRWAELFSQIGTVIIDECDTITSPSIFNFVMAIPAKFVIGMTATHVNRTRNHAMESVFGTVVKRLVTTQTDTHSSMAVQDVREILTSFEYEYQQGNLDYAKLQGAMMEDEKRNQLICHHVKTDIAKGLSPLIVTNRVPHVHLLHDMLREAGVPRVRVITGETNSQRKQTDSVIAGIFSRKYCCIVASAKAVMRGANLNPLDVIHITMPCNKSQIEQLVGRIRRKYPKKKFCLVRYYLDKGVPYLRNVFYREAIPCFRKLKVKRYANYFVA